MGLLSDLFGSKPKVPKLASVEAAQTAAVGANVASFADIAKLATQVDTFNQDQLAALMEKQLSGGAGKIRDLISSQLAGEIPEDVSRAVQRAGAERGVSGGFAGSQFSKSLMARDLGLTSLGIMEQGFNSALNWMQATKVPTFDVTSMFISPAQKYEDQVNQFNRDFTAAKIKASPDPGVRGIFDTGMQVLGMALSAYGGGAGYTNTYNPASTYGGGGGMTVGGGGTGFGGGGGFGGSFGPPPTSGGGFNFGVGRSSGGGWFLGSGPGKG